VLTLDYVETGHLLNAVVREGALWVSSDGGATWQIGTDEEKRQGDVTESYAAQLPPGTIASVFIPGSGKTPGAVVAGTPEGVLVGDDTGGIWTRTALPHEGSVTALARDPERRDRLYAATSTGYLFESGNRGRTWQAINHEAIAPVGAMYVMKI
jgi:hypothetical protein